MKKKHREAMIAYGLKIEAHEELLRRHKICLDAHGTRLAKHDTLLECTYDRAREMNARIDRCITRLQMQDEAFEAQNEGLSNLTESINKLSEGANEAGQDLLQRVRCLEQIQDKNLERLTTIEGILNNTPFSSVLMKELVNRVTALEGDRHTFLPHQHIGIEERIGELEKKVDRLQNANIERIVKLEREIKDQRDDYHAHIRQFVEENEAAHKRQEGINISQLNENKMLQQQVKEINARLTYLLDTVVEINKIVKAKPGQSWKVQK